MNETHVGADVTVAIVRDGIVEAPTWFGPADRPLFGWFAYPETRRVRGAVVLCLPLAEESNMAYRTFRALAQRLASDGFLVLRFDYDGTGDSAGSFNDPGRADAWQRSVCEAVAEARRWGANRVSVVGMRIGATLAYRAAARWSLDLDHLILWDPCSVGKAYLRELRMLQRSWVGEGLHEVEGWAETPSYSFAPETATDVGSLTIDGATPAADLAGRTTVLVRPDRPAHRALEKALPRTEVEWGTAEGQAELLNVHTLNASVPVAGVSAVVAALLSDESKQTTTIRPQQQAVARWREEGFDIEESAGFFGAERGLFGIRTTGASIDPALPRVLLLNVAAERHLGEGRLWLRIAREAAALGFEAVRLDHSGVGDSATRMDRPDDEVYAEGWIDDVPQAARELALRAGAGVVGIGLCSSATSALSAARHGSLTEVIAVNTVFDIDANAVLPPRWSVFSRKPRWLRGLAVRHKRTSELIWSIGSVIMPSADVMWTPREIIGLGARVTLLTGPGDASVIRHHPVWNALWGRRLRSSPRFSMQLLPDADHSLRVSAGQEQVRQAVLQRLDSYRE